VARPPGADDAQIVASFRMHDNQQFPRVGFPEDDEPFLRLRMVWVGNRQRQRVAKDRRGLPETDAMFGGVCFRLLFVPFKIEWQGSVLLLVGASTEAVFDVVVQDEIQLLRREPVVLRQHRIDFVQDGF